MTDNNEDIYVAANSSGHGDFSVDISPERAGWGFSGLKVLNLAPGEKQELATGPDEILVLPLSGSCDVTVDGKDYHLDGRSGVFAEITDFLYVGRNEAPTITSKDGGRFALPSARASRALPTQYYGRDKVRVDLRGAGDCSRQVNNYALANGVETSHLLCCEVLTPGGNWSSYPAHKHDETTADERELEEIYYFEIAQRPTGEGFAFHRTYGTPDRPIELTKEVHSGDVVLIPHGYHGPTVGAPGYDLYYLNVMAGPAEDLVWKSTDDPHYHWIRDTWEHEAIDPRLPMAH